jgi:uncharacterized BrkB/YihY/UPF0761 family membrane protein
VVILRVRAARPAPYPGRFLLRWRPLLWVIAFLLLALAAALAYSASPRLRRHIVPLSLLGGALYSLGWAIGPRESLDD